MTAPRWTILLALALPALTQDLPAGLPDIRYHLTARPWKPLDVPRGAYLDAIEGICRYAATIQDSRGAVIDPFLKREIQYATPYFAFAVGALAQAGRAPGLLENGIRAMEHATACFGGGNENVPDTHGNFFLPSLTGALELYKGRVPEAQWQRWRERMRVPVQKAVRLGGAAGNWRTYAMKGEWMRALAGLVDRDAARDFIGRSWWETQRNRVIPDKWNLYQDRSSDPDTHAVEAVGRGNLLALAADGYDGPFAAEIRAAMERSTRATLLLQDPTGQCPMNGRTDDHIFNDVLYQLAFEVMAERARAAGDAYLAGQYRHAAMLSFASIGRWRRTDGPWAGSYYVAKNQFDPALRVGYQPGSTYTNYNGATAIHLAEAWLARKTEIPEQPAPVEIGGYALSTDWAFGSVFANAGGMQMAANLRGDSIGRYETYWTPLGVARFGRVGWDTRLGPSDGVRDWDSKRGVSFAPTWQEDGRWVLLADVPDRYRGVMDAEFSHPLLVKFRLEYRTVDVNTGPAFLMDFTVTPDGILSSIRCTARCEGDFGVTLPLLENDGTPLDARVASRIASTRYPGGGDEQNFIALDAKSALDRSEEPVRSPYGWLRPVRLTGAGRERSVFIYPRGAGDPDAETVHKSFRRTAAGFSSVLGRVEGRLYVGRTSAGGEGKEIDLDGDGKPDAAFSEPCGFVLQLADGLVTAVEADRPVTAVVQGKRLTLAPYRPVMPGKQQQGESQ